MRVITVGRPFAYNESLRAIEVDGFEIIHLPVVELVYALQGKEDVLGFIDELPQTEPSHDVDNVPHYEPMKYIMGTNLYPDAPKINRVILYKNKSDNSVVISADYKVEKAAPQYTHTLKLSSVDFENLVKVMREFVETHEVPAMPEEAPAKVKRGSQKASKGE